MDTLPCTLALVHQPHPTHVWRDEFTNRHRCPGVPEYAPQDAAVIHCRAQVAPACYDGMRTRHPDGWREDGTYRRSDDSIVCDACYILLNVPAARDLEHAIRLYRRSHA